MAALHAIQQQLHRIESRIDRFEAWMDRLEARLEARMERLESEVKELRQWQRRWFWAVIVPLMLMLASSLFLFAFSLLR